MSDIVERLTAKDILTSIITSMWCKAGRHPGELVDMMKEAADEITRLRAENETLRRDVKTAVMGDSAELADVKRENEKLREALKPFADALKDNYYHQVDELPIIAGSNQMDIRFNWTLGDLRAAAAALKESGE